MPFVGVRIGVPGTYLGKAGGSSGPTPPTPTNDAKYWFDGLPLEKLAVTSAPTGGQKFWIDGLPVAFIG